jgi:hypothetical protein
MLRYFGRNPTPNIRSLNWKGQRTHRNHTASSDRLTKQPNVSHFSRTFHNTSGRPQATGCSSQTKLLLHQRDLNLDPSRPLNQANGPPDSTTVSCVKLSTMTMNTYAPMAVRICHQPWNSNRNPQGMPMARFQAVSCGQKMKSSCHRRYPKRKHPVKSNVS